MAEIQPDHVTGGGRLARGSPEGVATLVRRYGLTQEAGIRLAELARLLSEHPHAPTALRAPGRVMDDHLADSLVALELQETRCASRIVDLGSGAGLPGLPLAIAASASRFVLLESAARKCAFIAHAASVCAVDNAEVVHSRAESFSRGLGSFDLVLVRALAALEVVLEYAAPLLRLGGSLVVWRGRRDPPAEAVGEKAAALLGMRMGEVRRVQPYPAARDRHLHLFSKVRQTPEGFPRRPGVAAKRPLGRD